jgi:hypothetical protein
LCRNCLLKHLIEGKIEGVYVTGRRGRRRKQLLDDVKEKREHCKFKDEALDHTAGGTRFVRGYGHVKQTTLLMNTYKGKSHPMICQGRHRVDEKLYSNPFTTRS